MTAPYIILGGRGGIGESLCLRLSVQGHHVVATMRDNHQVPPSFQNSLIEVKVLDIAQPEAVNEVISSCDTGDGIAGIAYCIGSIDIMPLRMAKDDHFLQAYDVNVMGAIRVLRAAEKGLKSAKGSVILFSSIAVQQGFANHAVISTAKGAIEALTRSLAAEWAPYVRVNCIAPSLTSTPLAAKLTGNEKISQTIAASHPIPRLGTADDSSSLAAYLLGSDSGWVTGQVFHVDGGRSALRVRD